MLSYRLGIYGPFRKRRNLSLFIPHLISFMRSIQDVLILTHLVDFSGLLQSLRGATRWRRARQGSPKMKWNYRAEPVRGWILRQGGSKREIEGMWTERAQEHPRDKNLAFCLLTCVRLTEASFHQPVFKLVTGIEMRSRHSISSNQYSRQAKQEMTMDHLKLVGRSKLSLQRGPFINAPSSLGGGSKFEQFFR